MKDYPYLLLLLPILALFIWFIIEFWIVIRYLLVYALALVVVIYAIKGFTNN